YPGSFRGFDGIKPDLHWKFWGIFPQTKQLSPDTHGPGFRNSEEFCPMHGMKSAKAFRHQDVYRSADHLCAGISEHLFRLRVHKHNGTITIHENDAARRCLNCQSEFFLRLLALGDVY